METNNILNKSAEQMKSTLKLTSDLAMKLDFSDLIDRQLYDWEDMFHAIVVLLHVVWNLSNAMCVKKWISEEEADRMASEFCKELKSMLERDTWINIDMLMKRIRPLDE